MEYRQYQPPRVLERYVRYFWSFDSFQNPNATLQIKSFADKYPRLIFQNLDGFEALTNLSGDKLPACYLSGIDTKHTEAIINGNFSHFGVSFYPHGLAAFFGESPVALINQMPDIRLICPAEIQSQLQRATNHHARVSLISKFLYERLRAMRQDQLINKIVHHHGLDRDISLDELGRHYRISTRSLQRRFKAVVGISHKKYQRILRFEESLKQLANASFADLGVVAYDLKFTDQSHFIKDFSAFSGMSPYAFAKRKSVGSESSSFIYTKDA
ncbi:helix-turn-helix domain-containing protein [Pseudochryseolinea flava]|uniref:HTH araC/xylS-type domain-containing protein n=1 Tax=Pseudochryseolinea flava TaxID=2059302 RepID=A0A364XW59_9BACT|nr:AraC family transcriptional regulator [Pseudochryseolinea flava]RAV98568.1 hypothetical protein DQQ10_22785 [Pseudochryseolinea flava]